ncbi:MAG: PH domain-containing protein [Gammaproteobacteria bacterium]|nr:PH domain-containing protein [Gammaproteobacteria bacterium]
MEQTDLRREESENWRKTSPLSILYYLGLLPGQILVSLRKIFLGVAVPSGPLVWIAKDSGLGWKWSIVISLSVVVLGQLCRAICKYHSFLYLLTPESISVRSGIFSKERSDIKWNRVRAINTSRDPLELRTGNCTVALDTAGSAKAEITIPNIPLVVAEELQERAEKEQTQNESAEASTFLEPDLETNHESEVSNPHHDSVLFELSHTELVKFVLCSRGLVSSILGGWASLGSLYVLIRGVTSRNESSKLSDQIFGWIVDVPQNAMSDMGLLTSYVANAVELQFLQTQLGKVAFLATLATLLTFLFFVVSIVLRASSNYGFKFSCDKSHLIVRRGLFTKKQTRLEKKRIQVCTYSRTNRERCFRRGTLLFEQSESDEEHSINVPFLDQETADNLIRIVHDDGKNIPSVDIKASGYSPISIVSLYIRLSHCVLVWTPLLLLTVATLIPSARQFLWPYGILLPCYFGITSWLQWRRAGYRVTEEFIARREGVFRYTTRVVRIEKLQKLSINQNLVQRTRNTCNLSLNYLGGIVYIPYLNLNRAHQFKSTVLQRVSPLDSPWT